LCDCQTAAKSLRARDQKPTTLAQTQAGAFVKAEIIVTFGNDRHKRQVRKMENPGLRLAGNVANNKEKNYSYE
jgi:hypothetical protein